MWPIRTAVSGKQSTPGGATELMEILGKEESIARIKAAIESFQNKNLVTIQSHAKLLSVNACIRTE